MNPTERRKAKKLVKKRSKWKKKERMVGKPPDFKLIIN